MVLAEHRTKRQYVHCVIDSELAIPISPLLLTVLTMLALASLVAHTLPRHCTQTLDSVARWDPRRQKLFHRA